MTDTLATLKAAEAAGATIQAYTLFSPELEGSGGELALPGYWRDLESPVQWSCDPTRYRVKTEGV